MNIPDISAETLPHGRFYIDPIGNRYPSVTTILGKFSDKKEILEQWRARVGDKEADTHTATSANRGTIIHDLLEQYVRNNPQRPGLMPVHIEMFKQMKKPVDKHLTKVYGIEIALWSPILKVAGRCDLIGLWDNIPSIIDHKTAGWIKTEEDIEDYFLQCTIYSLMFQELTKIVCNQIVILIGCEDSPEALVFVKDRGPYVNKAIRLIKKYHLTII